MSYGVVTIKEEGAARKHFEFVKTMGMRTLVCEPVPEARDTVSRLADEYGLSVAIHNHPKPSLYWNPDTVLEALKERSRGMGACADTGHWTRSGLRPVEALKKLEGRVIELHFKDVARGVDQIWGTGDSNARAMLEELKRQGFRGQVYVEYESGSGTELEANVARCVAFFDATARELAAPPTKAE
jgi:sugar phosphate isomerase/epimerase